MKVKDYYGLQHFYAHRLYSPAFDCHPNVRSWGSIVWGMICDQLVFVAGFLIVGMVNT
jgi:hypothetical protein